MLRKNLKLFFISLVFFAFFASLFKQDAVLAEDKKIPRIEIIGDSIYIDGKKFLIKGVGYSPYRPDRWPGSPVPVEFLEADFKRMKEAGLNTLRVWDIMPEEQLELAEEYGINVIQAAGLMPNVNFGYSGFIRSAEAKVRQMCRISKNHPNVIMYLLMNEPHAQCVVGSGVDKTIDLYKRLIKIIKEEDPNRPISMANAYWTLWLDQSMWDVICFNAYSYSPLMVPHIGFVNFIENLKSLHSPDKPFVVTEFGLSVSPKEGYAAGYGGNTEEEQAEGLVRYYRELIKGGAAGGCFFEWNDEWWKADNPAVHDAHAEEWFGIIGIEKKSDPIGKPRKAYYSIKEELKLVITKPSEGDRILDKMDIEINASKDISNVQYRIDDDQWKCLAQEADWWRQAVDIAHLKGGLHALAIKALDGEKEITRKMNIIKCKDEKDLLPPINIEVTTDKPLYKNGEIIKITARLTDRKGVPLKNHYVKLGVFDCTSYYTRNWEGRTDENGCFSKTIAAMGRLSKWHYVYWASAEGEDYGYKTKEGKLGYVEAIAAEAFPIKWISAKEAKDMKIDGIAEEAWLKADEMEISADTNFMEGSIDSSLDLSARARVLWDKDNIYFLVSVKDDVPMINKNEKRDLWNGDCVELFISVDPTKIPQKGYSSSDFQFLIGTNGKMWIPAQATGGIRGDIPVLSNVVAKQNKEGYVLEAKINIANFWGKPPHAFSKDDILGFDIAIGDADERGVREGKVVWNGTEDGYKDSVVWGRLRLE